MLILKLVAVATLTFMHDLIICGIHDLRKHAVFKVVNQSVGDSIDLTSPQWSFLFLELFGDLVCDFLVLCVDEIHAIIVTGCRVRDNVFFHQEAFCLFKLLPLGDLFPQSAFDKPL